MIPNIFLKKRILGEYFFKNEFEILNPPKKKQKTHF